MLKIFDGNQNETSLDEDSKDWLMLICQESQEKFATQCNDSPKKMADIWAIFPRRYPRSTRRARAYPQRKPREHCEQNPQPKF